MACPHCQSSEIVRFGTQREKQRYRRRACNRAYIDELEATYAAKSNGTEMKT